MISTERDSKVEIYDNCPTIWVGVDHAIGSDVVVKADGVLLGPAHWLSDFIERGTDEAEGEISRRRIFA
jgi:hypothetical protein